MRVFPFLSKVPKYKRFQFEPRYYDQAKEELNQRTARIKREADRGTDEAKPSGGLDRGYLRASRPAREPAMDRSAMNRALLVILMGGGFWAWLEYGNWVLYPVGAVFLLYIYLRIRNR